MSYQEPLSQHTVAISISECPDMAPLGLGDEHLTDAMTEIVRHLLALGARLMYGGDLRPDTEDEPGFTRILVELISRHRRDADVGDDRPALRNVFAWPIIQERISPSDIVEHQDALRGLVEFVTLDPDGVQIPLSELVKRNEQEPKRVDWSRGLTNMRKWVTEHTQARLVLGGQTEDFRGRMPGIAEEAYLSLRTKQPLFILGGFGGCARDLAATLDLLPNQSSTLPEWRGIDEFTRGEFSADELRNGLSLDENATLASTPHIDEAVTLVLRGLLRMVGEDDS